MEKLGAVRSAVADGALDGALTGLMCGDLDTARRRVAELLDGFQRSFGAGEDTPITLCSAPGRTEICGNHTDHQHGRVLAAAVNLDFLACASLNGTNTIRFQSQGWPMVEVALDTLEPGEEERESTAALVRGMAAQAVEKGYPVAGFDVFATSEVLPGSGLSSSAACEVLLGVVENHLFCRDELDPVTIAQMGQRAENVYFGKPSGLMDQTASSVGGAVAMAADRAGADHWGDTSSTSAPGHSSSRCNTPSRTPDSCSHRSPGDSRWSSNSRWPRSPASPRSPPDRVPTPARYWHSPPHNCCRYSDSRSKFPRPGPGSHKTPECPSDPCSRP